MKLPFRKLSTPIALGSEPDVIDTEFDLGDATEVYGDNVELMFPEFDCPCDQSPSGQCEYDATIPEHDRCKHCKRFTG